MERIMIMKMIAQNDSAEKEKIKSQEKEGQIQR